MNRTYMKKFISIFWGLVYLFPLALILFSVFRLGFDYSTTTLDNIKNIMQQFEMPFFSDILDVVYTNLVPNVNSGGYILFYLCSWFVFVSVIKLFVMAFVMLICFIENVVYTWIDRR